MVRGRDEILRGVVVAGVLSGAPSCAWALVCGRSPVRAGVEATRAVGTLVWPGTPGLVRGAVGHAVVSLAVGGLLGVTLPERRPVAWGGVLGLGIGWVNLAVVARRRYPAIAALALGPQLADNAAFGMVFAVAAR